MGRRTTLGQTDRLKRIVANCLLLCFTLGVSLLCAELVLHYLKERAARVRQSGRWLFFEFDPLLGWRKTPGGQGWHETTEYRVLERINSKGLRGPECPYEKPKGEFRILALGDSFCEGYSVAQRDHFTQRLQDKLNGRNDGRRYRVLNGGTRGYSTDQELLFFETEGYKYSPDLVILMFYNNDVWYNSTRVAYHKRKPMFRLDGDRLELVNVPLSERPLPQPILKPVSRQRQRLTIRQWLNRNSIIYSFVRRELRSISWLEAAAIKIGLAHERTKRYVPVPGPFRVWRKAPSPQVKQAWKITEALLGRLNDEVRALGAQLIVFYIPNMATVQQDTKRATKRKYGLSDEDWDLSKTGKDLQRVCEKQSIPFINPIDAFCKEASRLQKKGERLYYAIDHHWNANGHGLAASLLFDYIVSSGMLSGAQQNASIEREDATVAAVKLSAQGFGSSP